jgi:hypothetical protein
MTLSEIATVSGKGGLFKVLAPTKAGVILESLDEAKTKIVATASQKLSLLNEISIYTTTKEGTAALEDVLRKINKEYGTDLGVDGNSDSSELKAFLKSILPEFDETRVYTSDMKKLVKWYEILLKYAPEILTAEKSESPAETKEEPAKEAEVTEAKKAAKASTEAEPKEGKKAPKKKS